MREQLEEKNAVPKWTIEHALRKVRGQETSGHQRVDGICFAETLVLKVIGKLPASGLVLRELELASVRDMREWTPSFVYRAEDAVGDCTGIPR